LAPIIGDVIADPTHERVPADARICLEMLAAQLRIVKEQILENDRRILASARETGLGRRLMEIPGVARCSPVPSSRPFRIRRHHQGRASVSAPDADRRRDGGERGFSHRQ
jgi:hypothetical protein